MSTLIQQCPVDPTPQVRDSLTLYCIALGHYLPQMCLVGPTPQVSDRLTL